MKKSSAKRALHSKCGRCCGKDELTYLVTRLAMVEGSVLEHLESNPSVTLHRLMEELEWEPCAVAMAVGSLVRQGLIRSLERDQEVFLELRKIL